MVFEIRMVWRETRPALKRFAFVVVAIALGVGVLSGLKGFTISLNNSIFRSARDLIAADMVVRMNRIPSQSELRVLESLIRRGALLTRVTETLSMVSSTKSSNPLLSDIRAVDPSAYPFYGKVELEPAVNLRVALSDSTAVVSRDLLVRSGISVGDDIQIGSARLRISAILKSEPDRIGFGLELGPRILITRTALDRSGLIQFGSRVGESFLYRLPQGFDIQEARRAIDSGITHRIRITDYRDPNPSVSRGLERAANFLSLVGLLSLLVGGLGISTTIHTYLQQKLDSIAVIKCIGGRSRQIIQIYLLQGLLLGVTGSVLGVALGYAVQLVLPRLLSGVVDLPANIEIAPAAAIQGFTIGVFSTLIFLITPLLAIRKIKPIRVFLREMPEIKCSPIKRLQQDPLHLLSYAVLVFGIGLAASWLAGSWRWGFSFLASLTGCLLVLAATAKVLLSGLKRWRRIPSLAFRHGVKNLSRPGAHAGSIMATLGLGVAFVLTIYFIQTSLISQIIKSAPADFPNIFLVGITEAEKPEVAEFLAGRNGIEAYSLIPSVSSHLRSVDGRTADQLALEPDERRFFQTEFSLTWSDSLPSDTRVIEGGWWSSPYKEPLISVRENAAQRLGIRVNSILEFDVAGTVVRGRVVNIRESEFSRPGTSNQFIFSPKSLDGLPASYIGAARVPAARTAEFQSALYRKFPSITSIDIGQVLIRVQTLLNNLSHIIRFVALFALISGIIVLAAAVVSTRYQRIREVVLLKTLGATGSQIARIQAAEFLILGASGGLAGCILSAVAAHFLLGTLLHTEFDFRWIPVLAGIAGTSIVAILTGWLANRGVLNHKPLEVLREN